MLQPIRAAWAWMLSDEPLFTSPGIGRVFMACYACNRVRPTWDLFQKGIKGRLGCVCGSRHQRPTNLPWWQAAWWLLVRGLLWRKWIRRKANWDPRMPMREMPVGEF